MRPSTFYTMRNSVEVGATLDDLLISKSRSMVIATLIFFLASAITLSGSSPTHLMIRLFALSLTFGAISVLAYRIFEHHYILGHVVWQAGLAAIITAAALILKRPELLLLIALIPLVMAITLGWRFALAAELASIAIILWAQGDTSLIELPESIAWAIVMFGALGGLLGWISTSNLITSIEWALFNFNEARTNLEEAREQRVELKQTQEDLLKANQEMVRLTERLKILQRIAEESRQAKVEFVSNVSHELRTPLNMIIGYTEVITRSPQVYGTRLPPALMTDISAVQRNSQHLLALVNDVLDLSQVEAGHMALSREWYSVTEMVQAAVAVVQGLFDSKGLYLKVELVNALPPIFCDQMRVRQVIINLLSNAGRFTSQGGVRIGCEVQNDQLILKISDTGPGIRQEDQARIFEPFQQLDNSIRRNYGGSGLGLTICKQFIELHGGKMWLESEPGHSTTFLFTLPLSPSLDQEEALANQRVRRGLIPDDNFGYTLHTRPSKAPVPHLIPRLIVLEKEQSLQRLLRRYLENTEVIATSTLAEAAGAIEGSSARALLINTPPFEDPSMELLALVPFGMPVISCWIPGEVDAARQLDVVQYLTKPVTRDKLLDILENLPREDFLKDGIRRVLVVDDEPDELHLFVRMLESASHSYQVLQVTNGRRALDAMRNRKPDIVLLDLMMPVMNGFQVLEEMRGDPAIRDIPVIVISSRDPLGEAITSNTIRVSHNGGFSTSHLMEFIRMVSQIILPEKAA